MKRLWWISALGLLFAGCAKAPEPVPPPDGWVVNREAGPILTLVPEGDVVWAGGKEGVVALDRNTGQVRQTLDLPGVVLVKALLPDGDGGLWIGHGYGLVHWTSEKVVEYTKKAGLSSERVNALLFLDGPEDDRRALLVGTGNGLDVFQNGRFALHPWTGRLPSKIVNVLLQEPSGALWLGSSSDLKGGLARIEGETVEAWLSSDGLPHSHVQDLWLGPSAEVFVATGLEEVGGLSVFRGKQGAWQIETLHKSDGLAGEKARSVAVDGKGNLWVGSEYDGLAVRFGRNWVRVTEANGLPDNEVTDILPQADGTVWLATLNGVVRLSAQAVDQLQESASATSKAKAESSGRERERDP